MTPLERIEKRLAELKELEAKATPGPWVREFFTDYADAHLRRPDTKQGPFVEVLDDEISLLDTDNLRFIDASRTAVPALIRALEIALQGIKFYCKEAAEAGKGDIKNVLGIEKIAQALCGESDAN